MASNNSSKTAHVMNLLSKNHSASTEPPAAPKAEAAPSAEDHAPQQPAAPAAPAAAPQVAPIISSINADAAVSSQIKNALEAELSGEPKPHVQQAEPTWREKPAAQTAKPVQREEPAPQTAPVQQEEPAPQPVRREEPVPQVKPEAAPSQEKAPAAQEGSSQGTPSYINVMQLLVDEKADEYMRMFGICCCDQCRVDVRAYALNHLPPKYVVLSENERVPRLTVYESRFSSDITAQLIQACKKVMLTPHHSRED